MRTLCSTGLIVLANSLDHRSYRDSTLEEGKGGKLRLRSSCVSYAVAWRQGAHDTQPRPSRSLYANTVNYLTSRVIKCFQGLDKVLLMLEEVELTVTLEALVC